MLYQKHLKPWLLIYLIVTICLFINTIAIIVIIIINDINGFNFISARYHTCLNSTNQKFNANMEIILKICFMVSIVSIISSLGQFATVLWQFIMLKNQNSQNDTNQNKSFQKFTFKILILLYSINFTGILSLIPIVGSFLSIYFQLSKCSSSLQNISSTYLIPSLASIFGLIFQILCYCLLLKLFYHYNEQKQKQPPPQQTQQKIRKKQKNQIAQVKKRILQSKKLNNQDKFSPFQDHLYESQTGELSPRQIQQNLLDKEFQNQDQQNMKNSKDKKESQQQISKKQKQLMKKLPKHPFKKNKNSNKLANADIIFEQPDSQEEDSQHESNKRIKQSLKQQKQIKIDPQLQKLMKQLNNQYNQSKQEYPTDYHIFQSKYFHIKHLLKQQNKTITPQQRRYIKRPLLKAQSKIYQFDSNNMEIQDFSLQSQNISAHKKPQQRKSHKKDSKGKLQLNLDKHLLGSKKQKQKDQNASNQIDSSRTISLQNSKSNKILNAPRYSANLLEQRIKQGRKLQYYNPIEGYVNQDQVYEQKINQILDYQKLSKRKRKNIYNQFQTYQNNGQNNKNQQKLYLHKNKRNDKRYLQNSDEQEQGLKYEPFNDLAFDDQILAKRLLSIQEEKTKALNKIDKKLNQTPILSTQTKKSSRKQALLLDFVRGKYITYQ